MKAENAILIAPPDADFVLIVSVSPWLWAGIFVFAAVVLLCLAAMLNGNKK